ncbi:MAG TPA: ABC transporter substrate-binding protein [Candidatus Limnocylindria bacterium]
MAPRPRTFFPLLVALFLAACNAAASPSAPAAQPSISSIAPSVAATPTPIPATSYPLILTDDESREVTLQAEPQRIVSLAPSSTEIVCALGACDRIVGVNDFRDGFPADVLAALEEVPDVASFTGVDREALVEVEPDLVLAAGNNLTAPADVQAMADLDYPVLVLYPESLEEVYADIRLVGEAIDARTEAEELVAGMQQRVVAVTEAAAGRERPRTFYEVGLFSGSIYTAGADSFLAALIELAGGEPITGDATTTAIQLEDLVAADPQLILLGDAAYDPSITAESVAARPGWDGMTAVLEGRVLPMPEDVLITRPGPRMVDGLEALARAIHPEAFD